MGRRRKKAVAKGLRPALRRGKARAKRAGWSQWIRTYQDELAVANGCWFDADAAALACEFIETSLPHCKGQWAGQPFLLLDWQRDIVMQVFGWRRSDGSRRFRKVFIFVPKKNGKTAFAAALALTLLIFDQEPGAEIYFCATKVKEQADRPWRMAAAMVRQNPELDIKQRGFISVHDHNYTIVYPQLFGATIKVLSAESKGAEGQDIHGIFKDELHVWENQKFWDALEHSGASRRQPLQVITTTAGDNPVSIGKQEYDYACGVRDGLIDSWHYLPVIYEADADDDPADTATWRKSNPSLGATITESEIAEMWRTAEAKGTAEINSFRRYRTNVWLHQRDPWLDLARWDACRVEGLRFPVPSG